MEYSKIIGIYDDEQKLYTSIDQIQEKGYKVADVVSPFPLEELFEKLGVKTRINIAAFFYALIGGVIGISAFLYYTAVVDYPLNIGGKPPLSLTFVVIIFVGTIFMVVLGTLLTFFIREKKGPGAKIHFEYPGVTDDKFALLIEKTKDLSEENIIEINQIIKNSGAIKVDKQ